MKRIVFVGMALIAGFVSVAAQSLNTTTTNRVLFESADRTDPDYHYSGLAVPHRDSLTTNYTLRMPDTSNVGVQQMLVTNGSGQLRLIAPTNVGNYLLTRADGSLAWGYPWADTTLEWTWYGNAVSQAYAGDGSATAGARLGTLNNQALQVVVGNLNAMRLSGSQVLLGRGTSSGHFSLASIGSGGGTFAIATTQTDHIASTGTGALRIGPTVAGVASGTLGGTTSLTIGTTGTSVAYQVAGLNGVTNALYSVGNNLQVASNPVNDPNVNSNSGLFLASSGGTGLAWANNRILYIASSGSVGTGGGGGSGGKRFVALATRGTTHPAYTAELIGVFSTNVTNFAGGDVRPSMMAYTGTIAPGPGTALFVGGRSHTWTGGNNSVADYLVLGGISSSTGAAFASPLYNIVSLAPRGWSVPFGSGGFAPLNARSLSIVSSGVGTGSSLTIAASSGTMSGLSIATNGTAAGAGVLIGGNTSTSAANNLVFNANPTGTNAGSGLSLTVRRTQLMSTSDKPTSVVLYEAATNGTDRVRLLARDVIGTQTYTLPSSAPAAANRPLLATTGGTMQWASVNVLTRSAGRIATGGNQVVVINDASVQAANQILVTYEDPAGAVGIDGRVTARAANVSFTVTLSAVPPGDSFINYVILP